MPKPELRTVQNMLNLFGWLNLVIVGVLLLGLCRVSPLAALLFSP